jgi:murein L,D-transpeptidase YcbB/YkuD
MGQGRPGGRPTSRMRRACLTVLAVSTALVMVACGGNDSSVEAAQARVTAAQKAVTDAQTKFDQARSTFCDSTKNYLADIDRYGKAFDDTAATVGDIKTVGADLEKPREAVTSNAEAVVDARDELTKAKQDLAEAEAALAAAKASASGTSAPAPPRTATSATTTEPLVPPATVDRVKAAESDLAAASQGITDQTPLRQATAQFNAAAYALEVAWLRLFADAGCLTDDQQVKAEAAVHDYTASLQTALHTAGYYAGEIDGIYGPSTVKAVEELQKANGLPVTGLVDRATAAALSAAVTAKGGAAATQALAHTAAVQSTLKLAGYWNGPVDGQWSPELTEALKTFQTTLGVPPTGAVDAATLSALQDTIAKAKAQSQTTTTTAPTTTT